MHNTLRFNAGSLLMLGIGLLVYLSPSAPCADDQEPLAGISEGFRVEAHGIVWGEPTNGVRTGISLGSRGFRDSNKRSLSIRLEATAAYMATNLLIAPEQGRRIYFACLDRDGKELPIMKAWKHIAGKIPSTLRYDQSVKRRGFWWLAKAGAKEEVDVVDLTEVLGDNASACARVRVVVPLYEKVITSPVHELRMPNTSNITTWEWRLAMTPTVEMAIPSKEKWPVWTPPR